MNIFRELAQELSDWAAATHRKPLILRGARQTGKSYLVESLLKKHFRKILSVNFEKEAAFRNCFRESLSPTEIIPKLEILLREKIVPGETLLFFDELQDCPEAITGLRYFYEELPALHVIGAGSLLEFALGTTSFPVGRVSVRYVYPLTFREFLFASSEMPFLDVLDNHNYDQPFPQAIHQHGLKLLQQYLMIGGMPASVRTYLETKNFNDCQQILEDMLELYKADFPKYAERKTELEAIASIFLRISQLVCQQLKYVNISRDLRQEVIKACIALLDKARVITRILPTHAIPLAINAKDYPQKLLFLDVGLMQRAAGFPLETWVKSQDFFTHNGQIAEQFVGQELLSLSSKQRPKLYYWNRIKRGSSAEVDYLIHINAGILPIEVKSGASGKLRSLKLFLEMNKNIQSGIKVSAENCRIEHNIRTIPLYAFSSWFKKHYL